MRSRKFSILAILIVLACCFFAGCSTSSDTGGSSVKENNLGVSFPPSAAGPRNYSFEEVKSEVYTSPIDPVPDAYPDPAEVHILSITGENLDENANASRWIFVVRYKNTTDIVTYDQQGQSVTTWTGGFNGIEVYPDQVVSPRTLFDQNRADLFKTTATNSLETRRLELSGGNYSLIVKGPDYTRMFMFDAKTGALTFSNDR